MRLYVLFFPLACAIACAPPDDVPPKLPPGPAFQAPEILLEDWAATVARGPSETRIAVTGRAAIVEGEPAIAFTVTNISSKAVRLWRTGLPWGNTYSIDLAAMTTDRRVLGMWYPIDDPGPGDMSIAPGQVLSGTYPLSNIKEFEESRKRSDVIVLWSYRLVLVDEEREAGGLSSGVVVFGKTMN